MTLTERQRQILNWIVENYIELARPISSFFLEKKYHPDFSSATIRLEYKNLTQYGYLEKVHISSGRIPTDKAYEFFANEVLKSAEKKAKDFHFSLEKDFFEENLLEALRKLSKRLATSTKCLIFIYYLPLNLTLKEGWENVLEEPEFGEKKIVLSFINFIKKLEKSLRKFCKRKNFQMYIGKKIPFSQTDDFSLLVKETFIKSTIPESSPGTIYFFLSGPKRMDYRKNITVLFSLEKLFQKLYVK